jgi:hypothetical protein
MPAAEDDAAGRIKADDAAMLITGRSPDLRGHLGSLFADSS